MIYTKLEVAGAAKIPVPLRGNEIYSSCPVCGVEVHVDYDIFVAIVQEDDLEGSSVYCDPCSDKYREGQKKKIYRIK